MAYLLIAVLSQVLIITFLFNKDILKKNNERYIWFIIAIGAFIILLKFLFLVLDANMLYKMYSPAIAIASASLLYLYVHNELNNQQGFNLKKLYHLIPTLILTIVFILIGAVILFKNDYSLIIPYKKIYNVVLFSSYLTYHPYILFLITIKHKNKHLKWLVIPLILWITANLIGFLNKAFNVPIHINYFLLLNISGFLVFIVQFFKLKYNSKVNETVNSITNKPKTAKYEKSSLKIEDTNEILNKLSNHMKAKKPFLDNAFSLSLLSKQVNISKHHITEVLNTTLQKNFFLFVNEYKIEEAKKIMQKNNKEKLQTVAHLSGFNSKTTFIKYFKQIEGITPSEYRKKNA
ncbi:helix-turn-helix domain-containing protein [Lacinutrix venerupis]|uniref:HTH araC/xylS-type domain-containing protein n=1 Tax=Lacinutrix venerupis TaxID=1486034 RepID=A0AAC9LJC1_9FLAO|nr:helix-turn-helix domain-containing protein [Lacinutrix venerupis]APX99715.1 hypothetical protein BWR22_05125 [Lacinutrix venerupis]